MMKRAAARTFAQGLLDAAWNVADASAAEQVEQDLRRMAKVMEPLEELDGLLQAGAVAEDEIQPAVEEAARKMRLSLLASRFLELLVRHRSTRLLPVIAESYTALLDRRAGRATARVQSAVALTDDERSRLRAALSKRTGLDIRLEETLDPELLGGLVVRVGDQVLDGSLRTRLDRVRGDLARG